MEDYELSRKLLGYDVWEEHSFLTLTTEGVPMLTCDYKPDKNALWISKHWIYKDNEWKEY